MSWHLYTCLRLVVMLAIWLGAGAAFALAERPACVPDPNATSDPLLPPNARGATPVEIGFYVTELRDIDVIQGSFQFHGSVFALWCDPRLAFDPAVLHTDERILVGPAAEAEFERIWNPRGFPSNRTGSVELSERVLRIRSDGAVRHDMNVKVDLATAYDLRRFPFDRQTLVLHVESASWNRDQVRLLPNVSHTGFSEDFELPEWRVLEVTNHVEAVSVIRSDVLFDRSVVAIEIARESGFYLWKVMLPLFIIVAISWSVFWMSDERFAGRSRISATGVLTIVAYQFVMTEDLPRVAYLTVMDKIMILSFGLLAVTVLESLFVSRHPEGSEEAHQIDRRSRWAFPLAFTVLIGLVFVTSG